jgi:hypothetical protein
MAHGEHHVPEVEGNVGTWAVARAAGVSYRRIDHWVRRGYIAPVGEPNPGSGADSVREFTPATVARTVLLARLVRAGVLPGPAARLIDERRDVETGGSGWVAVLGDGLLVVGDEPS